MRLRRHGGGGGRRRRRRRSGDRAAGAARVVAERLPLRHRSERFSQVSTAWEKGGGGRSGSHRCPFFFSQEPAGEPGAFRRWSLGRPESDGHRPDGPAARPVAAVSPRGASGDGGVPGGRRDKGPPADRELLRFSLKLVCGYR